MSRSHRLSPVLPVLTAGLLLLSGFPAAAEEKDSRLYLNVDAGPNWMQNTQGRDESGQGTVRFDTGARFGVSVGYHVNRYATVEVGTAVLGNEVQDSVYTLVEVPVLFGGLLRYPNSTRLEPYVGGGFGFASSVFGYDDGSSYAYDADVVMAWQGQAGVRCRLTSFLWLGLAYQYTGVSGSDYRLFGDAIELDAVHSHSALLNLHMRF